MDGVILLAFILGFPANETVIPIILMGYMGGRTLTEHESLATLGDLLTAHGTVGRFVTSDAHILAEARSRMRRDAAREGLSEAKTMGMSVDEMIEYIKEESEK